MRGGANAHTSRPYHLSARVDEIQAAIRVGLDGHVREEHDKGQDEAHDYLAGAAGSDQAQDGGEHQLAQQLHHLPVPSPAWGEIESECESLPAAVCAHFVWYAAKRKPTSFSALETCLKTLY